MIDLTFLPKLIAVHTSATMSPGPNFAVVFKLATEQRSPVVSLATTAGVTLGILIHASLALFGVSHLISSHPLALNGLKFVAAAYLSYLAFLSIRGIFQTLKTQANITGPKVSNRTAGISKKFFALGFVNCIFNPKAFLYFMTVLPQGLNIAISPVQTLITLGVFSIITFCWFSAVAAFFQFKAIQAHLSKVKITLSSVTGALFLTLATGLWIELYRHLINNSI